MNDSSKKEFRSILIITQYYPPEVGGGAMRSAGIAEGLTKLGVEVRVIAPQPSYMMQSDKSIGSRKWIDEYVQDGITIYRPFVYSFDRKGFFNRILYYISFMISAMITAFIHIKNVDVVMTISPPLFTGVVGVFVKKLVGAKMIFDVGDLWPESAIRLGFLKNRFLIKLSRILEHWIYKNSDGINLVTELTKEKFANENPSITSLFYVPNFVNTEFIQRHHKDLELCDKYALYGKIVFGYAGNIGGAQGINIIIMAAKLLRHREDIVFFLIGDGIEKSALDKAIKENALKNIIYIPPVSQKLMNRYYSLFDFSIIPLVMNELFRMTIPSKLYECMAAEIPVILCVDGEAKSIIEQAEAGYYVEPENHESLVEAIINATKNLEGGKEMGKGARSFVQRYFERDKIIAQLKKNIEESILQLQV